MRIEAIAFAILLALAAPLAADDESAAPGKAPRSILVELVDTDGQPVEGADVGFLATVVCGAQVEGVPAVPKWSYIDDPSRSDANGVARLADAERLAQFCLFARCADRRIAAITNIDRAKAHSSIRLTLVPEREVVVGVTCTELAARGKPPVWVQAVVSLGGKKALRGRFHLDATQAVSIPLPPGDYDLEVRSYNTHDAQQRLRVVAGSGPQRIDAVEIRATNLALLEGQPAPEIPGIIGWKNENPGTLAELRGRVVLLEFWGYWCGPCVGGMPELFALHDKYRDRGLVIIGIHLDMSAFDQPAVDTAAKLDELLLDTRKDLWAGRDIPFPVALVASKPTPFRAGLAQKSPSAASALYGVTGVPTQVLIDRHGNVVGRFSANGEGIQLLEKLIQEK